MVVGRPEVDPPERARHDERERRDPQQRADLLDLLTSTLFAAPVYKNYGGLIAARRYEPPGFNLKLGAKDVGLVLSAAGAAGVPMPFASVLRDNLIEAIGHGDADKDLAALAEVARRRGRPA